MGLSKVKSTKQKGRLISRIANWEKLHGTVSEKDKVGKENGFYYRKPGSNRK